MEPGNLQEQLADIAETVRLAQLEIEHQRWVARAYETRSADLLYALIELNHHFYEHGLSRGNLTARTQEVLTAVDLGAYGGAQ